MNGWLFLIAIIIVVSAVPAFGQLEIDVRTSKDSYVGGDIIIISGSVSTILEKTPVIIKIIFGDGTVEIAQIPVSQDKKFTHTTIAQGKKWNMDGIYTVEAIYNSGAGVGVTTSTNFEFMAEDAEEDGSFRVDGGSADDFDVSYMINGGTVNDIAIDYYNFALVADIDATKDGSMTVELPRESIDAKTNGCSGGDEVFITLIDSIEVPYENILETADARSIKIGFEMGDSEISIIGTCIVPEFGAAAMVVFAATIVSVLILSNRMGPKTRIWP